MSVSFLQSHSASSAYSLVSLNSNVAFLSDSPTVTFGVAGNVITASAVGGAPGAAMGISAGSQSVATGTLVMSNSNGLTFGMSGSSRVTASHDGIRSMTAGTTHAVGPSVSFGNGSGVSFGVNGSTLTASVAAGATATGNLGAIAAGTQTATSGTVVVSDSNGLTFGLSGSTRITGSHDGIRSMTAGTTHALGPGVSFGNGSGVSFGANGSTLTASVAAGATATGNVGGIAVNAATTFTSGTVVFSNSNGVTFGTNAQTITASVAGAATGALWHNIPPVETVSGALGTFAFTGSHRSILVCPLEPDEGNFFPCNFSASTFWLNASLSGSAATMSSAASSTWRIAIYTRNGVSLSIINSASFTYGTNAGNANLSRLIAGQRWLPFVSTAWSSEPVFSAGIQYWLATHWSSAGQLNQTGNILGVAMFSTAQRSGTVGVSETTHTSIGHYPFYGIYTATTAAFPNAIQASELNKVAASAGFVPHVAMVADTAISAW